MPSIKIISDNFKNEFKVRADEFIVARDKYGGEHGSIRFVEFVVNNFLSVTSQVKLIKDHTFDFVWNGFLERQQHPFLYSRKSSPIVLNR